MICLFYCISHNPGPELAAPLPGVAGRPVYQVADRRLRAAVSRINRADLTPDLPRVRAYERVVSSCHRRGTVVPMRYGCVVEQESQVIEMLSAQGSHYEALLQELEGCVEMGLRVLLPSGPWAGVTPGGPEGCSGGCRASSPRPRGRGGPPRFGLPHGP